METKQQSGTNVAASAAICNDFQDGSNRLSDPCTKDGSIDWRGKFAIKRKTGGWKSGMLLLVNEGLAIIAFTGVEVNMVLFSKTVLRQSNAEAANMFSRWMGTLYIFSLLGAFLSDSYLGRYLTCIIFQAVLGLATLSLSTHAFMLEPKGCGRIGELCNPHTPAETSIFYLSIYLLALGSGAVEPVLATFGADQFDEDDPEEKKSKTAFFGYFYVALNLGSLIAETFLVYLENMGKWVVAFWISTSCGFVALILLLSGTCRYRHFKPSGNPISRFSQVIVASMRKLELEVPSLGEGLHEIHGRDEKDGTRRILHTNDFKFLDRAAIITPKDMTLTSTKGQAPNPWRLCTVTQVEELIVPLYVRVTRRKPKPPSELQRMGIGLAIGIVAMIIAALVEQHRFLDRAAIITPKDMTLTSTKGQAPNPWRLCTVTQVEEVKCVLRLLPIWSCTMLSSLVFIQMISLFIEQGAAMNTLVSTFHIPPASMTAFDIISTSTFIICYDKLIVPLYVRVTRRKPKPPSELQRMGIGLAIGIVAMIIAALVEQHRLRLANEVAKETSSLSILWQTPQYVLVGVAEAFMYVAQWEFFAAQIPDGLKSLGLGLSMSSAAMGSYLCSMILTVVMKITSNNGKPGWITPNLNDGHMDRFFFLSAALTALNLGFFIFCAKRYNCIVVEKRDGGTRMEEA
ncbi:unnamed protein product [Ilex paraguariensis]|uniref:Uncharacterized protein n=1 Tax=Ilex paraguariensis TaxID=185542 RepID=A0ABC8UZN2_9AQUA